MDTAPLKLTAKNLIFPQYCQLCGRRILTEENLFFCPKCWEESPRIGRPFCPVCGRPSSHAAGLAYDRHILCGPCATAKDDPPYRHVAGAAYYMDAVEQAIKLLKFHGKTRLAGPLSALIAETAAREFHVDRYDLIVPVPLHRVRQRQRGFNQSLLLAEAIASSFPRAAVYPGLVRNRPTHTQSLLKSPEERKRNVKDAFGAVDPALLGGKTVLLVDDVITSHGTVRECARVLREAGVEAVDVLVAALAVPGTDSRKK